MSGSMWFYVNRILRPQQVAEAALHNQPRGNLSDLYPRWYGARELLRRGRNPYSAEITREIQQGYYGRPLDPSRPEDPKDQQSFAYPAYVVFLLAPTVHLPFAKVQDAFRWLLVVLAVAGILLWLHVLRCRASLAVKLTLIVLVLGWLPMAQGFKLQQLTLLVAAMLAVCVALVSAGWLFCAGAILALATIKPQLAWPVVLWLMLWAGSQWRLRWRLIVGFGSFMAVLLGGAEWILPGWWRMFIAAIRQYHQYTQNESVLVWLFGSIVGHAAEIVSAAACGICLWRTRHEPESDAIFGRSFALVLALTVLIVPMYAPYNQVLLLPALLALLGSATNSNQMLPGFRLAGIIAAVFLLWPWIASLGLFAMYPWLTPDLRQRVYLLPFYSNFEVPVFIFALALLDSWRSATSVLRAPIAAE
jgi:hypothetical protein